MAEFFLNFLLLGIEEIQQKMEWDNSKYVYLTHNVILNFTTLDSFICKIHKGGDLKKVAFVTLALHTCINLWYPLNYCLPIL